MREVVIEERSIAEFRMRHDSEVEESVGHRVTRSEGLPLVDSRDISPGLESVALLEQNRRR